MSNGFYGNPCLKTGGWVHIAQSGQYVYGDVFGDGTETIWVRVIDDIPDNMRFDLPEGDTVWACLDQLDRDYVDSRMRTIIGRGRVFYAYDGCGNLTEVPHDD